MRRQIVMRREMFLAASLAFVWTGVPAAAEKPGARPNVLFCLADDWAWPHAGAYGDRVVKTPTFDRVADMGVLFRNAFVAAPTCTASRGGMLTGQAIPRLAEGANLWSRLPARFKVYADLLEKSGYVVGCTRKGWGPGTLEGTGRMRNPAGPRFKNFRQFLATVDPGKPFCFWFGSFDPHRPYKKGSGRESSMAPAAVQVPPFLPDTPTVRSDLLDYYVEVQRFDREVGEILQLLEKTGRLDNTLVVISGDNGIPFPKAKATLYDAGTRVPLAIFWKAKVPGGRVVDDLVSLADLAPTFLQVAGLKPLPEMTGRSLTDILLSGKSGLVDPTRDKVFTARERHCYDCNDGKSYPVRAVRTADYLYIRNLRPDLWPAGAPPRYDDVDGSPTRTELLDRRDDPAIAPFFRAAFAKRPAEELYDIAGDPGQMYNLAGNPRYADVQKKLGGQLRQWMTDIGDPRAAGETDQWDESCVYTGRRRKPTR